MPDPIVVVLGKAKFRASEEEALVDFGRACAIRGKQLLTTKGDGAAEPIRRGYEKEGGTPKFLKQGDTEPFDGRYPVVLFTDKRMQDQLDERMPDWRTRTGPDGKTWIVIHNPKETEQAGRYTKQVLAELGTPLTDGG